MSEVSDLYDEALRDYHENRLDAAIHKLEQVLALTPHFEDAYEALSVILYNQKRYDDAVALIKKWVAVNPDSIMSRTNLSRCYVAKGMIKIRLIKYKNAVKKAVAIQASEDKMRLSHRGTGRSADFIRIEF